MFANEDEIFIIKYRFLLLISRNISPAEIF